MKKPASWTLEEHIFGASALRDEIRRRKENGEWHGILNETAIRALVVYGFTFGLVMAAGMLIAQKAAGLGEKTKSKRK